MPSSRHALPRIALMLVPLLLLGLDTTADAAKSRSRKAKSSTTIASMACNDYYGQVNGEWLKAHPAPTAGSVSAFDAMLDNARAQQRALLEDLARDPHSDADRALGMLWTDGMNESAIETAAATPLQPLFDRIAKVKNAKDLSTAIADLHAAGMPVLFNFAVDMDLKDFDRQFGYASQGGLGLPDPDYYTRTDADTRALLGRYRSYVEAILRLSGTPVDKVSTESGWVLSIEMQLAQASLPLVQLRDPNNAYRPISLRDLQKAYPNLAFDKFLRAQRADDDHVSLASGGFFQVADGLLASVPVEQWQAYLRFHAASALAPYLSRGFQDAYFQLYGHLLGGDLQPIPRVQLVLDAVDRALGDTMGHAWAERYLPQAAKDAATRVADGVRAAMKNALQHSAWMDDATRVAALAKLDKLRIEIGESSRKAPVSGLALGGGNFAVDMLAAAAWSHQRDMAAIGKRTNERRWPVLAQIPDVSYDLVQNRVIVTAAFLQPPAFDASADSAQQFGALGPLLGHQLHYAFDGKGRSIDADGQLRDWWTQKTAVAFEQSTAPIVAQYDGYAASNAAKINGRQTRDENIADLAGLELAWDAFKASIAAQPLAKIGGLTPEQRFFEAYAKVWQRNSASDALDIETSTSIQAPAKFRVNGPLVNLPEFGKVYACKAGQPMKNRTPVSIWR